MRISPAVVTILLSTDSQYVHSISDEYNHSHQHNNKGKDDGDYTFKSDAINEMDESRESRELRGGARVRNPEKYLSTTMNIEEAKARKKALAARAMAKKKAKKAAAAAELGAVDEATDGSSETVPDLTKIVKEDLTKIVKENPTKVAKDTTEDVKDVVKGTASSVVDDKVISKEEVKTAELARAKILKKAARKKGNNKNNNNNPGRPGRPGGNANPQTPGSSDKMLSYLYGSGILVGGGALIGGGALVAAAAAAGFLSAAAVASFLSDNNSSYGNTPTPAPTPLFRRLLSDEGVGWENTPTPAPPIAPSPVTRPTISS